MKILLISSLILINTLLTSGHAQRGPGDAASTINRNKCKALNYALDQLLEQYVDSKSANVCSSDADCTLVNTGRLTCSDEPLNNVASEGYKLYYADSKVQSFRAMKYEVCPQSSATVRCAPPLTSAICENNICVGKR